MINLENNSNKTASCILRTKDLENCLKYKNNTTFLHPIPKFYEQLLDIWYAIPHNEPVQVTDILQEYIRFNARILLRE